MPTKNVLLSQLYRHIGKPIFFRFDPEIVHDRVTNLGAVLGSLPPARFLAHKILAYHNPRLTTKLGKLVLTNPVGLSAGFDKEARLTRILPAVGFGFAELGSITHLPYAGNPRPRLYRLPKSRGIVVYYGLKNSGTTAVLKRLPATNAIPYGISIAKSNDPSTNSLAAGIEDYVASVRQADAHPGCAYITLNISCPNTFGGEPFTTPDALKQLLNTVFTQGTLTKPVFIKMPIDLAWTEFQALLEVIIQHPVTGVVIGNLTKNRHAATIQDPIPKTIQGGISGKPTEELANHLIEQTYRHYGKQLAIIGVGGIFSAEDAYHKLRLGASAVQLITGMIFEGPQLIGQINAGLIDLLDRDKATTITEIIGRDAGRR